LPGSARTRFWTLSRYSRGRTERGMKLGNRPHRARGQPGSARHFRV
jgi:hypothetical protein